MLIQSCARKVYPITPLISTAPARGAKNPFHGKYLPKLLINPPLFVLTTRAYNLPIPLEPSVTSLQIRALTHTHNAINTSPERAATERGQQGEANFPARSSSYSNRVCSFHPPSHSLFRVISFARLIVLDCDGM